MIWYKKEGADYRRGVNFIFSYGGFGIVLFMAGYKWRMTVGFYVSRKYGFYSLYRKWDSDQDFKDRVWASNLYTREAMLNEVDRRLADQD